MQKFAEKVNIIFSAVFILLFAGCFIMQSIYSVVSRYTSLVTFVLFIIMAAVYFEKIDHELIIVIAGCLITGINLIIINSNKGAFLTAANLLLMLYLTGKVIFERKNIIILSGFGSVLLLAWYTYVRWDYNFNMAGLVFMITSFMVIIFSELECKKYPYLRCVQILSYFVALLFTILYHSRCVMMGMIIFGILFLAFPIIKCSRILKLLLVIFSTVGSVIFTRLYVALSDLGINVTILYKDLISGRQDIWSELWQVYLQQPFTGIGSSYEMKNFFIFEVHNGLFDILCVHGLIVFLLVLFLLIKKLIMFLNSAQDNNLSRIAVAGVFSILFTSFFENFFIVSPYLLVMFLMMNMRQSGLDE